MMYNCNIVSIFLRGYRGKTIDFAEVSCQHRTTTAYFLNHGKWNDSELQDVLKRSVIQTIYRGALLSGKPVFCIPLLRIQNPRHRHLAATTFPGRKHWRENALLCFKFEMLIRKCSLPEPNIPHIAMKEAKVTI